MRYFSLAYAFWPLNYGQKKNINIMAKEKTKAKSMWPSSSQHYLNAICLIAVFFFFIHLHFWCVWHATKKYTKLIECCARENKCKGYKQTKQLQTSTNIILHLAFCWCRLTIHPELDISLGINLHQRHRGPAQTLHHLRMATKTYCEWTNVWISTFKAKKHVCKYISPFCLALTHK